MRGHAQDRRIGPQSRLPIYINPRSGPQAIPTGIWGPIPPGTVGLILGRNSFTMKGFHILPSIIDKDCKGEIKVMTHTIRNIVQVLSTDRITQLVLVPTIKAGQVLIKGSRRSRLWLF